MSECPVCGGPVSFETSTIQGELLDCNDCNSELEVTSLNPPNVIEAPQSGEDWGQ